MIISERSFVGYGSYPRHIAQGPAQNPMTGAPQSEIKQHLEQARQERAARQAQPVKQPMGFQATINPEEERARIIAKRKVHNMGFRQR